MFKQIKGGSEYKLFDAFGNEVTCYLPPVGFGINTVTGRLEKTDIIKRSDNKKDQYWERSGLPDWWDDQRSDEKRRQENDRDYVDPKCEDWRISEWRRRFCGVWVYMNGKPIYLTGRHWFMLEHWKFQGKYFDFRLPNMEFFYFIEYCYEDTDCLGCIEVTKRKDGKTARAGCLNYEYISRTAAKHGGIQSKTDPDAAEVFQKGIVNPWQKLPDYFRPTFDDIKGDNPEKELRFFNSTKKGKRAGQEKDIALESFIDFKPRGVFAYDGPELHWYTSDEAGKLKDVSILDRHNVVRFCSEVDGNFVGFQHYTTTVEEMENGGGEFEKLVRMSNMAERSGNNRTKSGMYCWFLPSYKTLFFDKYGIPNELRAREYYENERASLKDDTRTLSSTIRKNPFNLDECFMVEGDTCLYDPMKLNLQLNNIFEGVTERGNFVWKNGERFTEVEWAKEKDGRFEMPKGFRMINPNNVIKRGKDFHPANTVSFVIGCDPFKYDKTKDNRRSDCAAFSYKKFDALSKSDPFNDAFVCKYAYRAQSVNLQNEDILKMCWYFGCQVLYESNVDNWKPYFREYNCNGFLMVLPGETEPGVYNDGSGKLKQQIASVTESFINDDIGKFYFKSTIKQWLNFKIEDTTKFDEAIAAGITLIAARNKIYKRKVESTRDILDYFKMQTAPA